MPSLEPGDVVQFVETASDDRFFIVVSQEQFNRGNYFVGVPITSQRFDKRRDLPNCVPFRKGEYGFSKDCVAQVEATSIVAKKYLRLERPVAHVESPAKLQRIYDALCYVMTGRLPPSHGGAGSGGV